MMMHSDVFSIVFASSTQTLCCYYECCVLSFFPYFVSFHFPINYYYYYYYNKNNNNKCQDLSDAITTVAGALYKVYQ